MLLCEAPKTHVVYNTLIAASDKGIEQSHCLSKTWLSLIALIMTKYQEVQINRLLGPPGKLALVLMH